MNETGGDYDYIIRIIQYLDQRFGVRFFISSKDFDVLYRWWEKRIPQTIIHDALEQVVQRNRMKNRPIASFAAFSAAVRKNYQSFLTMNIGRERSDAVDEHAEIRNFLARFPERLTFLKKDFEKLFSDLQCKGAVDAAPVYEKLLKHFRHDEELRVKSEWFMKNLSPHLRKPGIEKKYRQNFLASKFGIPSFD